MTNFHQWFWFIVILLWHHLFFTFCIYLYFTNLNVNVWYHMSHSILLKYFTQTEVIHEVKLLIINTMICVYHLTQSISTFVLLNSISINVVNKPKSWTIAFFIFRIHCRRSRCLVGLFTPNLNKVVRIIEMGLKWCIKSRLMLSYQIY